MPTGTVGGIGISVPEAGSIRPIRPLVGGGRGVPGTATGPKVDPSAGGFPDVDQSPPGRLMMKASFPAGGAVRSCCRGGVTGVERGAMMPGVSENPRTAAPAVAPQVEESTDASLVF